MENTRKMIGVCGARIFEQNTMKFLDGLKEEGKKHGYLPIAFSASIEDPDALTGEKDLFELCHHTKLYGLVVMTETLKNNDLIQQVVEIGREKKIPVFSVDGKVEGCFNILLNYWGGFEQIVRHVVEEHGARYVNMVAGFQGNAFSEERIAIYRRVLEENGIPFEEERVGYGDFWEAPTRIAVKKFLESGLPRPDAIICANDAMAVTVCAVLKEAGIRVPQDVIVTGFDGIQEGKFHTPMLATCEPMYQEPLHFIYQEIKQAEQTGNIQPCDFTVDFTMIRNQSCGCKPKTFYDRNGVISSLFAEVGDCAWHNLAMNRMVNSVLDKYDIMEIAEKLPENVKGWSDHFHFACVKSELMESCEVPEKFQEMVTILRGHNQNFEKPGERFSIEQFLPHVEEMESEEYGSDVLIVNLLNSGPKVYGYLVEGFRQLDDRRLQRCNEFAMFLSYSISAVLHNNKLNELNQNLTEAYNEISSLYLQDAMTGVYNRRGFSQKLTELLGRKDNQGKILYIISIDMDKLKFINDNFGHAEGDFAITTTARAMTQSGGEDAVCARFGGDEFVCAVIADQRQSYQEKEWSERINQSIHQQPEVAAKPYPIKVSVGMASCPVERGMDAESLIRSADKRMYQDKVARKQQRLE